ncbi:MAG: RNA 2',3'-cyclic phosphodiesterase [Planctomycetaceae bacterium]|nr:RNA 2',3'-cyclic phosphodiesterase [Planctomycetaceae bacterium]
MAAPVRLFIAAPVPNGALLRRKMTELASFRGGLRVIEGELHLTLKFLGDTPWERTAELSSRLLDICESTPACSLTIRGVGAFPRVERPRVVWVGVDPQKPVVQLANSIETACTELGFPREDRPYRPHITLARVNGRPPRELADWITSNAEATFHSFELSTVCLIQSELRRAGPLYTPIASMSLRDV